MDVRWLGYGVFVTLVVVILGLLAFSTGAIAPLLGDGYHPPDNDSTDASTHGDYEHTTVTVLDGETGSELGSVEAAIADTFSTRYLGLSATESLPTDRGMLFVHDSPGEYTYVMREMSFGIDIVFIDANGTITTIHEAPKPAPDEDGNDHRYTGHGQYVLEVNKGWMADHGVSPGDTVAFEL